MAFSIWDVKLVRDNLGRHINEPGGMSLVVAAGGYKKVSLLDKNGAAIANPVPLVNGRLLFYTLDTVKTVDIYTFAPNGQFFVRKNVLRAGPNEWWVDEGNPFQLATIPWDVTDYTSNAENSTGMQFASGSLVLPGPVGVRVVSVDDTETILAGLLSSEAGGDADGFFTALSVATTGFIPAGYTWTTGWPSANTLGALLSDFAAGSATDDRGAFVRKEYVVGATARTISITPSAGSDTGTGLIVLPFVAPPLNLGA